LFVWVWGRHEMVRPQIDRQEILKLLNGLFDLAVEVLSPVGTGQIASAFSYRVGLDEYVLRLVDDTMATSFGKDQLMSEKLAPLNIPVPAIVMRGSHGDLHYAISRRVPGVQLDELPPNEFEILIPSLIDTLDAIHGVDIGETEGFGPFDDQGTGLYSSWAASILSVVEEGDADSFFGKWHQMFDETFLDRVYFDDILARMNDLLKFCPEERFLVHADFGFGNVLAHDGKITAVLDWSEARYGDFLVDVAWLDLGMPEMDFLSRFRDFYESKERDVPHFEERVACYQFYMSLDAQRWYAKTGQVEANDWMKGRLARVIERLASNRQ